VQASQINSADRWSASLPVHRADNVRFADTRLGDARSPNIQPTTPLSPGLIEPTFVGRAAVDIPWKEAGAYRQSDTSVSFAMSQVVAQNAATGTPPSAQTRDLALLAADVYRNVANPPAGYRVATQGDLGALGLKPADLTSTQSPFTARVYVKGSGADAEYVVAFRGSASSSDWATNPATIIAARFTLVQSWLWQATPMCS
jgi:hypothetical protein